MITETPEGIEKFIRGTIWETTAPIDARLPDGCQIEVTTARERGTNIFIASQIGSRNRARRFNACKFIKSAKLINHDNATNLFYIREITTGKMFKAIVENGIVNQDNLGLVPFRHACDYKTLSSATAGLGRKIKQGVKGSYEIVEYDPFTGETKVFTPTEKWLKVISTIDAPRQRWREAQSIIFSLNAFSDELPEAAVILSNNSLKKNIKEVQIPHTVVNSRCIFVSKSDATLCKIIDPDAEVVLLGVD